MRKNQSENVHASRSHPPVSGAVNIERFWLRFHLFAVCEDHLGLRQPPHPPLPDDVLDRPDLLHLRGGDRARSHLGRLNGRVDPHEEADLLKVGVEVGQVLACEDCLRASWTLFSVKLVQILGAKLHLKYLIFKFPLFVIFSRAFLHP